MRSVPSELPQDKLSSTLGELIDSMSRTLSQAVEESSAPTSDFAAREEAALELANRAVACYLRSELQKIADEQSERLLINGQEYRRHSTGRVQYHSLCGTLEVERSVYRACGPIKRRRRSYCGQAKSVVPLELEAGIVKSATPALAFSLAEGYAVGPTRQYQKLMASAGRRVPARATLERLAVAIGGMAKQDVATIEPCLRRGEEIPPDSASIVVGLDRTSTPMIEEIPPGQERAQNPRKRRKRPYRRTPPDPFEVKYRMAYVGTVTVCDRDGDALLSRRFAATAEEGPDEIIPRMMAEVRHLRDRKPALRIAVVQDGAPEMWNIVRPALKEIDCKPNHQLIDFYHASERIAAVLELTICDAAERQRQFARWKERVLTDDYAMPRFVQFANAKRPLKRDASRLLLEHINYLHGYYMAGKLKYASARRCGIPVGSGVTEGACKSLIAARVKRSGQRWYQDGLTSVLTLRSLDQSDRLRPFWRYFSRRFRAHVQPITQATAARLL